MTHPPSPWRPASLGRLALDTLRSARDDRITGLGAEVAFFSLLALPPTLLAVFGSLAYIADALGPEAAERIRDQIVDTASNALSADAVATVRESIDRFLTERRAGVAAIGFVAALWSASRATRVFIDAVNIAYDTEERRPLVRKRLVAVGITAIGFLAVLVIVPLMVAGPRLGEWVGRPLGLGGAFATAWRVLYWPAVGVAGVLMVASLYHIALALVTPWRRDLPGAVLAAVVWMIGGVVLRLYARLTIEGGTEYGSLGAPIVLLLWLYLTSLALLMGAELNAEIEKLWPSSTSSRRSRPASDET